MIELYDYYRSGASYRVRIALNYKNIAYRTKEVHLVNDGGSQHSAEYKQVNYQELVPSLKLDNNTILTQSLAIIEYLEEAYPTPALLPQDLILKAQTRAMVYMVAYDTHPLNNLRVLNYLKDTLNVTDSQKLSWYHHWLTKCFNSYEHYTQQYKELGDFSLGTNFTLADVCLVPQVYSALRFEFNMDNYPRVMHIYNNCLALPYVDAAKPLSHNN